MSGQLTDSSDRGQHILDWVRRCLTNGHVSYRPGLTNPLNGLSLQDVLHVLRTAETPGREIARDHFIIRGRNVDGTEIEVLVSVAVRNGIKLLRASLPGRDSAESQAT